jgi:hypothetical protein
MGDWRLSGDRLRDMPFSLGHHCRLKGGSIRPTTTDKEQQLENQSDQFNKFFFRHHPPSLSSNNCLVYCIVFPKPKYRNSVIIRL